MSRRLWARLAAGVSLGVLLPAVPAAAGRDRTPPTTPANLRITATTDDQRLAGVERVDRQLVELLVLRPDQRRRVHPSQPAADDVDPRTAAARTHPHLLRLRPRHCRESVGEQQHGELHDAAGHKAAQPAARRSRRQQLRRRRSHSPGHRRSTTSAQVWTSLFVNGSAYFVDRLGPPNFTLPNLTPATTYEFQVTVRDASRQRGRVQRPRGHHAGGHRHAAADRSDRAPAAVHGRPVGRPLALDPVDRRDRPAVGDPLPDLLRRRAQRERARQRPGVDDVCRIGSDRESSSGRSTRPATCRRRATRSPSTAPPYKRLAGKSRHITLTSADPVGTSAQRPPRRAHVPEQGGPAHHDRRMAGKTNVPASADLRSPG